MNYDLDLDDYEVLQTIYLPIDSDHPEPALSKCCDAELYVEDGDEFCEWCGVAETINY